MTAFVLKTSNKINYLNIYKEEKSYSKLRTLIFLIWIKMG